MRFSVLLVWVAGCLMLAGPVSVSRAGADDRDTCDRGTGDEAIAACTRLINSGRWPDLARSYTNRGNAYDDKGDHDRAITDYNEAIRLDPKDANAYVTRGNAYDEKGDHDRAITDYNEAIRFDPQDFNAYSNRGVAYANKGDYDRAIADYDQAIKLDPNFPEAIKNRADAIAKRGH